VNEAASLSAIDAVSLLSRATARPYRLVGPLVGGETGAHEVHGPDGERLVAKWEIDPSSQDARCSGVWLTDRLREVAGWPVPRHQIVETDTCLFVLQEFLPGLPVEMLTHVVLADGGQITGSSEMGAARSHASTRADVLCYHTAWARTVH